MEGHREYEIAAILWFRIAWPKQEMTVREERRFWNLCVSQGVELF